MIKYIFPFLDFTYILQLEGYYSSRYLQQLFNPLYFKYGKRDFQKHDTLKYTKKAILIISVSIVIFISLVIAVFTNIDNIFLNILLLFFLTVNIPIIVYVSSLITSFTKVFYLLEIIKAKRKVQSLKNLRIVAITGSYGKTTTKNIIYQLIKYNYITQYIENNINTPIGIAKWVNKSLKEDTEILVVEMGAYYKGVIKRSVSITPPDYAIITELGDQHIERFGSFENLLEAKLEIFSLSETKKIILEKVYKKINKKVSFNNLALVNPDNTFSFNKERLPDGFFKGNLALAIKIAELLNIPEDFIKDSIYKLQVPQRRKKILKVNNFDVLDDSYNISLNTAKLSLKWAHEHSKNVKKKLIVITAGIPEVGKDYKQINKKLGLVISKYSSDLFLLNSVFKKYILDGFGKDVQHASSIDSAIKIINKNYSPSEYTVLILPELTDLHY